MSSPRRYRLLRSIPAAVLLAALWVLLAGPEPAAWAVGGPFVLLALVLVLALPAATGVTPRALALASLAVTFLADTLRGAVDIGARSLAREPAPRAGIVRYRTRLVTPVGRLTLVHAVSLVPGTLTARISGEDLEIHVFDQSAPWREGVVALETRIARAVESGRAS